MPAISISRSRIVDDPGGGWHWEHADHLVLFDEGDVATVDARFWQITNDGYAISSVVVEGGPDRSKRKGLFLHREIVQAMKGLCVHHKNGNKLDNRRRNLAVMTASDHLKLHHEQRKQAAISREAKRKAAKENE